MNEHPLATIQKLDPEIVDHLHTTDQLIYADGALPKKFKLLMAMAFDAAHGAEGGVRALANAALREGATKEQIAEALRVAYHLAGVGTLYTASRALKELVGEA
jgi:alkylhydroperoxidase/carboxymuconolactone decarboxylase family protein YurZ